MKSGLKVGLWTSPHIVTPAERFIFNGEEVSQDELLEEFKVHLKVSKEHNLSFYEFLFYVFMKLSLKRDLDVLIFEVGLGGRLDAVNFFDADLTGLVSISRDHAGFLGTSLRGILFEKMGVLRKEKTMVGALESEYLRGQALLKAGEIGGNYQDLFAFGDLRTKDSFPMRNKVLALHLKRFFLGEEKQSHGFAGFKALDIMR